jgi:hypothetical protein
MEIQYQSGYMSTDLKPDFASIHAHLAPANTGPNTTFMGDLASPGALRIWKRPPSRARRICLAMRPRTFTVEAEKVHNTTATISMGSLHQTSKIVR